MLTVETFGRLPSGLKAADAAKLANLTYRMGSGRSAAAVSISVVDDREIRRLNRLHRGLNRITDVLSFRYGEGGPFIAPVEGDGRPLGDIVICLPQVRRQAKIIGRSATAEFALMVVHGVLHLLGYDHETLAQEKKMFRLQQDVLFKAGII